MVHFIKIQPYGDWMDILWFYIAVVLSISDEIHKRIMWNILLDFYIVTAGIIQRTVISNIRLWLIHEFLEAIFHLIVLSVIFLSLEIGVLGAAIHFVVDVYHQLSGLELKPIYHRALHFTIESLFFILVLQGG